MEFCPSSLFLQLGFFKCGFPRKFFQLLSHLLILILDVLQIALPSIEIMFIFSAVITTIIFLNYFCLFVEKLALLGLVFILLLVIELATADEPAPDSLDLKCGPLFLVKLPLNFEHSPVLLNYNCC